MVSLANMFPWKLKKTDSAQLKNIAPGDKNWFLNIKTQRGKNKARPRKSRKIILTDG